MLSGVAGAAAAAEVAEAVEAAVEAAEAEGVEADAAAAAAACRGAVAPSANHPPSLSFDPASPASAGPFLCGATTFRDSKISTTGQFPFGAGRDMFLMSKGATHRLPL
jgi:hypothetical protein